MGYEKRPTQEKQILDYLIERQGKRVEAYKMVYDLGILQYCGRIAGIRKKGYTIENKIERKLNVNDVKVKCGYYRIIL